LSFLSVTDCELTCPKIRSWLVRLHKINWGVISVILLVMISFSPKQMDGYRFANLQMDQISDLNAKLNTERWSFESISKSPIPSATPTGNLVAA
jgi:hypothetical protein